MTYVLGNATNASAPARLQNTCDGDDFFSLGAAYGVSPEAIIALQPALKGRTLTKALVQGFVKSLPGWSPVRGLRPFSTSDNPGTVDENGKPEGYAIFTAQTQLMLPDIPRLDGKSPAGAGPVVGPPGLVIIKKSSSISPVAVAAIFGLFLVGLAVTGKKKSPSRSGSGSVALTRFRST